MNLAIKVHCVFVFSRLQSLIGDVVVTLVGTGNSEKLVVL